ncbi:MAG: MFS transporter [Acetobacteraceae bacterium]|nr:MFS transporter [Acetobacteraceae bacterium]
MKIGWHKQRAGEDNVTGNAASPRVRSIQRTALALLVCSGVINYIDRVTLSIGNPLIRQDLGLTIADMGVLLSAFLWAYAFSQLPVGALIDRFGPHKLLSLGLALWSVAQAACGIVVTFGQFIVARVALGIGEAPQFPTGARVVRDWFNVRERGGATGIFNSASTLGSAIAAPLLTGLMLTFGWRWMFIIMGGAGLVVALIWFLLYRDPAEMGLTEEEHQVLTEGDTTGGEKRVTLQQWGQLFRFRTTWGMILGYFGTIYITWLFNSWLPAYLELERHMTILHSGLASAVPATCGIVGAVSGGFTVDYLVRRGVSPINSRKYQFSASLLGMAIFTILAAYAPNAALAIAFISAAIFLGYVSSSTAWAMASVAAPANCTASIGSMQNFGGYIGGALAPTVTGFIVQATGSFVPALLLGAGIGVASAACYFFIIRDPITEAELGMAPGAAYAD